MTKPLEQAARELAAALKSREERDVRAQIGYVVAVGTMGESRLAEVRLGDDTIVQAYIPSNLSLDFGDQVLLQRMRQGRWAIISGGGRDQADSFQEDYSATANYGKSDIVRHNKALWIAVRRNGPDTKIGAVTPGSNGQVWKKYAEDGSDGQPGEKGDGYNFKGKWQSTTSANPYVMGDVVRWKRDLWVLSDATATTHEPGVSSKWSEFVKGGVKWEGNWAPNTDYDDGDLVYHGEDKQVYVCTKDHNSSALLKPGSSGAAEYWELYGTKGEDGSDGMPGADGSSYFIYDFPLIAVNPAETESVVSKEINCNTIQRGQDGIPSIANANPFAQVWAIVPFEGEEFPANTKFEFYIRGGAWIVADEPKNVRLQLDVVKLADANKITYQDFLDNVTNSNLTETIFYFDITNQKTTFEKWMRCDRETNDSGKFAKSCSQIATRLYNSGRPVGLVLRAVGLDPKFTVTWYPLCESSNVTNDVNSCKRKGGSEAACMNAACRKKTVCTDFSTIPTRCKKSGRTYSCEYIKSNEYRKGTCTLSRAVLRIKIPKVTQQ